MPKKRADKLDKQFTLRMPQAVYDRIESAALALGIDATGLIRMMCVRLLPEFERQAKEVQGGIQPFAPRQEGA